MPDVNYFEQNNISVDQVRDLLDKLQTVEAVASHFGLSGKTVRRFINGKLERRYCWHPIKTITTSAKPSQE